MRFTSRLFALSLSATSLLAVLSCKTFDPPSETCDPRPLNAKANAKANANANANANFGDSEGACSRCLEDRCCDLVGRCERKGGCAETVRSVHECVLEQPLSSARREPGCAAASGLAGDAEANLAYRCMRDSCGRECGLPVCKVDPAAALIQSARCDGCFSGACCEELGACYGSRACKLMIECTTRSCGEKFGRALREASAEEPPASSSSLCDVPGGVGLGSLPECARACFCRFRDNDQGLPPEDPERRPLSLALRVVACGARARCGPSCIEGASESEMP